MDPTDNPTPFNARNPCWSCLEGRIDQCEWLKIQDEIISTGIEFYGHATFDLEGLNPNQQTERKNSAKKATRHFLYRYYHHQFVGGTERTPLPMCIEAKIKEAFPSVDGVFIGYQEEENQGKMKKK